MARLQIFGIDDKLPQAWLEPFKQYASVPDDGRDALLLGHLRSALLRVQEYADRALLHCHVRQSCRSDEKTGKIRLYLGGGDNLTVRTVDGAVCLVQSSNTGNEATLDVRGADVIAEFDTDPLQSWLAQAQPTVFRLATAIYDGEPTEVLNSILNEVL